jgi:hypothetical protein
VVNLRTVKGELAVTDPFDRVRGNCHHKVHTFRLQAGKAYVITLVSRTVNCLRLEDAAGKDQGAVNQQTRMIFTPPREDTYRVIVTSLVPGTVGPYILAIAPVGSSSRNPGPHGRGGLGGPAPPGVFVLPERTGPGAQHPPDGPFNAPNGGKAAATARAARPADPVAMRDLTLASPRLRVQAFDTVVQQSVGEFVYADADRLAAYVLGPLQPQELRMLPDRLATLRTSRTLPLAMADVLASANRATAPPPAAAQVIEALTGKPVPAGDAATWRQRCRTVLLQHVLAQMEAHADPRDALRDLYREQGALLGMPATTTPPAWPAQALERLIQHVAATLANGTIAGEDRALLDTLPRELQAARFLADNDLEHTVLLQGLWLRILAAFVAQQNPARAAEARTVAGESNMPAPRDALEQLRANEARILHVWILLHQTTRLSGS